MTGFQEEVPTFTEIRFERRHRTEASTRFEGDVKKVQARERIFSKEETSSEDHPDWQKSVWIWSHRPLWFRAMHSFFAE